MTTPPLSPWERGWPDAAPAGGGGAPYPPAMSPVSVATVPPPARGGLRGGAKLLAVFLAAELTFLLVSLLVVVPFAVADPSLTEGGPLSGEVLLVALAVPTLLAAVVAVGGTALLGSGPRPRLARELAVRWNARDVGVGLALGVGGLLLTIPAAALWAWWVGADDATSAVGEVFDGQTLSPAIAVAVFLVVWLVAPLCEEVLFRGVLWRTFEHWHWNRWLVFAVTTVMFSFAHLELLRTPLLLVVSIPIGLARLLTGNLLGSVVAHQANNFLPAVGLLLVTLGVTPT